MKLDDAVTDRLRGAFNCLSDKARPASDCPPADLIWSALRGELSAEQTRGLVDHTIQCAACAEAWRLARDLSNEVFPKVQASAAAGTSWVPGRRAGWWALAAAALVVALLLPVARRLERPEAPGLRGIAEEPLRSLLTPETSLPRDRVILRWEGPEGAHYDIRVATEDLRVLAKAFDLKQGEYQVPEEALRSLPAGARIVWQVEAVLPNGDRLSSRSFLANVK